MAKKREAVDELLDALVWMRRKAKKREAVDDLVDALLSMRHKAKKKAAQRKQVGKTPPRNATGGKSKHRTAKRSKTQRRVGR